MSLDVEDLSISDQRIAHMTSAKRIAHRSLISAPEISLTYLLQNSVWHHKWASL